MDRLTARCDDQSNLNTDGEGGDFGGDEKHVDVVCLALGDIGKEVMPDE